VQPRLAFTGLRPRPAQEWKAKLPRDHLRGHPAENGSGVTERYTPFVNYL